MTKALPDTGEYGRLEFQQEFGISAITCERLEIYADLLRKWQNHINLVSRKSLSDLWRRHMRDSAQLSSHTPPVMAPWVDIGSGAGFPGLVLAILRAETEGAPVHLIESDQRKSIFLQEVIRMTHVNAMVHAQRIETLDKKAFGGAARLITARAIAPLHQIFSLTENICDQNTLFLLLKGQDIDDELTLAAKYRKMTVNQYPSLTNPSSMILRITEVARV